jgi:ubiquinol-cytochrome c reductase cytochrome b subunit
MPAYGNALNPSETTALVAFLKTLRGNDLPPAQDASRALAGTNPPDATAAGEERPSGQSHLSKEAPEKP